MKYLNNINLEVNPGKILYDLLQEFIPYRESKLGFIAEIDSLMGNSEYGFSLLSYQSSIYYLLRRLIRAAQYFKKQLDKEDNFSDREHEKKIREYLRNVIVIEKLDIQDRMTALIVDCVKASEAKIPKGIRNQIVKDIKQKRLKCYMCDAEISEDTYEIEHLWPRSLGGLSSWENLLPACHSCNNSKTDYIDASDYHYESIIYSVDDLSEIKKIHKIAVAAKNNFQCSSCNRHVMTVGRLNFIKDNPNDIVHFLNILCVCSVCIRKKQFSNKLLI